MLQLLLDDARKALVRRIVATVHASPLEQALAVWLTPDAIPAVEISSVVSAATSDLNPTYRQPAILGIASHVRPLDEPTKTLLVAGLRRLLGREPVVSGTPMPFCMDGLALVGVMLGVQTVDDEALKNTTAEWFVKCRQATGAGKGLDDWQEWLLFYVGEQTGIVWEVKGGRGMVAAEVAVALRSKGMGPPASVVEIDKHEQEVIGLVQSTPCGDLAAGHAILRLAALNWTRRVRPAINLRSASVEDLSRVLRGVQHGLKRWTWEGKSKTRGGTARKWHIDNEYHVQNLLWLLLAPIFPDLDDEVYTGKLGSKQPRADIGIRSLRVVVEAKFLRPSDPTQKMIEEIAEDASLYLVEVSDYDGLVPFIWDDSRRSEQHDEMVRGLRQIEGVLDAIVISRPGSMT